MYEFYSDRSNNSLPLKLVADPPSVTDLEKYLSFFINLYLINFFHCCILETLNIRIKVWGILFKILIEVIFMKKFGRNKIALFLACTSVLGGKIQAMNLDEAQTQQTLATVGGGRLLTIILNLSLRLSWDIKVWLIQRAIVSN